MEKGKKGPNVHSGSGSKSGRGDGGPKVAKVEREHNVEFAKGGNTPMFGEQAAGPEKAGTTAHDVSGGAPGAQYASGGKGKMFGYSPSEPAKAGITSAR